MAAGEREELGRGLERFATRTPTLPPATHTNSYALGEREVLLVEPAPSDPDEQRAWLAWARALCAQGRQLRAILLTHHHRDHVGAAALAARELSLPLWAHPATAERLPELSFGRLLQGGERLALEGGLQLEVLHTPGHAPGHLCFRALEAEALVVGDMVASEGTILIDPIDGDMRAYLRSLEKLAALGARLALPAHGAPIAEPSALFRRYVEHRLAREAKVLRALQELCGAPPLLELTGPSQIADPDNASHPEGASLDQLVAKAYADTPEALWPLAKLSLEAHLQKLLFEGRAKRTDQGWST